MEHTWQISQGMDSRLILYGTKQTWAKSRQFVKVKGADVIKIALKNHRT